jgi:hypothetical protein
VAKVNNMAYRSNNKIEMSFSLKPEITIKGDQALILSLAIKL